ncbi:MAG: hypothetical protein GC204_12980 [Chloroflexi bacterium]|nr:hypothetical protein [Chloroflexota bacterium]
MAVLVEKWLDEPIIVLKPDAQVTQQELIDAWFQSVALAQTIRGSAYRIVDLRMTNSPDTVASWLRSGVQAMAGAPVEASLRVSFVGIPSAAVHVHNEPWFQSFDDALNEVHAVAGLTALSS